MAGVEPLIEDRGVVQIKTGWSAADGTPMVYAIGKVPVC